MKTSIILSIFVFMLFSAARGQQNDTLIIQGVNWNNHSETFHSSGDIISPQDTSQAVMIDGVSDVQFLAKRSVTLMPGFTAKASTSSYMFLAGLNPNDGSSCEFPLSLSVSANYTTSDFAIADSVLWLSFIPQTTSVVYYLAMPVLPLDIPAITYNEIAEINIYTDDCANLSLVSHQVNTNDDGILPPPLTLTGLTIGQTYYMKLNRSNYLNCPTCFNHVSYLGIVLNITGGCDPPAYICLTTSSPPAGDCGYPNPNPLHITSYCQESRQGDDGCIHSCIDFDAVFCLESGFLATLSSCPGATVEWFVNTQQGTTYPIPSSGILPANSCLNFSATAAWIIAPNYINVYNVVARVTNPCTGQVCDSPPFVIHIYLGTPPISSHLYMYTISPQFPQTDFCVGDEVSFYGTDLNGVWGVQGVYTPPSPNGWYQVNPDISGNYTGGTIVLSPSSFPEGYIYPAPGIYTASINDWGLCNPTALIDYVYPHIWGPPQVPWKTEQACDGQTVTIAIDEQNIISGLGPQIPNCPTCPNPMGPFSYLWSPGGATTSSIQVGAGTYTCTVTDLSNPLPQCATTIIVCTPVIDPPLSFTAQGYFDCWSGLPNTGSAYIIEDPTANNGNGLGGTGAYTYSWSSSPAQNTITAINLPSNGTGITYTVTVVDALGCTGTATATVTLAGTAAVTATATPICSGDPNATSVITAIASGTGPFNYSWSPSSPPLGTSSSVTVPAGTYTVTVDNGVCPPVIFPISVPIYPALSFTVDADPYCQSNGTLGEAYINEDPNALSGNGLGGFGGYTYSWSTSPTPQTSLTATSLSSGTYTVTVTDANNCTATGWAPVLSDPPIIVNFTMLPDCQNSTCNLSGGNAVGFAIASGGSGPIFTYDWSTSPAQSYTTSGTCTATALSGGSTYTVTVTDGLGCSITSTATISSTSCCCRPPGLAWWALPDLTNQTATWWATNHGGQFYIDGTNNTIGAVIINCVFTVDEDFIIDNQHVLLGADAKIIINAGKTLTITNGSRLSNCCDYMWESIELSAINSHLIINSGALGGCIIEHAKFAISSPNGGDFQIDDAEFKANYVHISLANATQTPFPGWVRNTLFHCPYPYLIAPYAGALTVCAIAIGNSSEVLIGDDSWSGYRNTIKEFSVEGIFVRKSNVSVVNNDIQNLKNAIGIYDYGDYSGAYQLYVGSNFGTVNPDSWNAFLALNVGIYSQHAASSFDIQQNTFDEMVLDGIFLRDALDYINIFFNVFTCPDIQYFGIATILNHSTTSLNIEQNIMTLSPVSTGIFDGAGPVNPGGTAIHKNEIFNMDQGIRVSNENAPFVNDNHIHFDASASPNHVPAILPAHGISIENCQSPDVTFNSVDWNGASILGQMEGISVEFGTAPHLCSNYVYNQDWGIVCNEDQLGAVIKMNQMWNSNYGFLLDNAGQIYQQGTPTYVSDNTWHNNLMSDCFSQNISNQPPGVSEFITRNLTPYTFTSNNDFSGAINITDTPILTYLPPDCANPSGWPIAPPFHGAVIDTSIVSDTLIWIRNYEHYLLAKSDTSIINSSDSIIIAWVDSMSGSKIGTIRNISVAIDSAFIHSNGNVPNGEYIESAIEMNASLDPANWIEENIKSINSIYLHNINKLDSLSNSDYNEVAYIASKCPHWDGPAVYLARLIMQYNDSSYIESPCSNSNRIASKKHFYDCNCKLIPNPAGLTVQISCDTHPNTELILTLTDPLGRNVLSQKNIFETTMIPLDHINAGVYFYTIHSENNSIINSGKVVVIK